MISSLFRPEANCKLRQMSMELSKVRVPLQLINLTRKFKAHPPTNEHLTSHSNLKAMVNQLE